MQVELTNKQRSIIFWSSFLALMTAGVGFGIRVMSIGIWEKEFKISGDDAGALFGASLWPIAVGMILFSLIVDKIGYKVSMMIAFASLAGSSIWTLFAQDKSMVMYAFLLFGFGHGVVEAVINPLCATMYKKEKSKMLNILHASWPAGVALGALLFILFAAGDDPMITDWRTMFWFVLLPAILFGIGFIINHVYPQDERVENNVSYRDMLREFGGLGIFLAATFLFYEFASQLGILASGHSKLLTSLAVGAAVGIASGIYLQSKGKVMFFILCLIMIPLATAEIATDGWIRELMQPVIQDQFQLSETNAGIAAGYAIVLSASIMMVLRFFAGIPLRFMSAPTLLLFSSIVSIVGLFMLSSVSGLAMILLAFVLYGIGQTFYWPTVLGFTSEQFPKGGAMTLNTVSAMGLLTVGIFGTKFLGAVKTNFDATTLEKENPALYAKQITVKDEATGKDVVKNAYSEEKSFFGWQHKSLKTDAALKDESLTQEESAALKLKLDKSARKTIRVAAVLPAIMAIAFLLIIIYYKMRGGYKPVHLNEADYVDSQESESQKNDDNGDNGSSGETATAKA